MKVIDERELKNEDNQPTKQTKAEKNKGRQTL